MTDDPVRSGREKNSVNGRIAGSAGRQSVMVTRREGKIYIPEGEKGRKADDTGTYIRMVRSKVPNREVSSFIAHAEKIKTIPAPTGKTRQRNGRMQGIIVDSLRRSLQQMPQSLDTVN